MTMMILFRWGGIINFQPQVFFLAGGGGHGGNKKVSVCTSFDLYTMVLYIVVCTIQYNTVLYLDTSRQRA